MYINVLSYNISWATQINLEEGSEKDFVEQCKKTYKSGGKTCIKKAIGNIKKLDPLDLVGLQEVNSDIETHIMKVQPNLKEYKKGQIGLSCVSILWNPTIFGKIITSHTFNLVNGNDRPCLVIGFDKDNVQYLVINVHMPWFNKRDEAIKTLETNLKSKFKNYINNKNIKIIMLGDFNDSETLLGSIDNPLILKYNNKTTKLSHKKTKKQAKKTLKSCCWHKPKHQYKYFSDTGDYILVNKNIKQKKIFIPPIFRISGRLNRLFSDHKPIMSRLKIV
jgi:endonuclease/exonuclease/phosphatase family metal-dependent hydrolase